MKLIAIVGPTAVGKTDISLEVAKLFNGEIVNLDSIQIYKELDIGSAKPSEEEMKIVPHHIIDCIDPFHNFSVAEYQKKAMSVIEDIISRNRIPILTGGTGLYLNSLYYKMDFNKAVNDTDYRNELENIAKEKGPEFLHQMLEEVDKESAKEIHPNNIKRVIRALEIYKITGKTKKNVQSNLEINPNYDIILVGLKMNRMKLYARINHRVDLMIQEGLVDEVKYLKSIGLNGNFNSMMGIGYKEVLPYLDDQYDLEIMTKLIKQNSRHYAKRQMTWFKRYQEMKWFDIDKYSDRIILINEIQKYIHDRILEE